MNVSVHRTDVLTQESWIEARKVFNRALGSTLHHTFGTADESGQLQLTPIGSLMLRKDRPEGFYLDVFNKQLATNLNQNPDVILLAVDARKGFWLKSLLKGGFQNPPALRMRGQVGPRRRPSEQEVKLIRTRFGLLRHLRGGRLLWKNIRWVRSIAFSHIEHIQIGRMTDPIVDREY